MHSRLEKNTVTETHKYTYSHSNTQTQIPADPPKHTYAGSWWDTSSSIAHTASSCIHMCMCVCMRVCMCFVVVQISLIVLFLVVGIQRAASQHQGPDPAWDAAGKTSWQPLECFWRYKVNWALTSAPWEGSAAKTQHRPPTGLSSEAYIRQWSVQDSTIWVVWDWLSVLKVKLRVCLAVVKQKGKVLMS